MPDEAEESATPAVDEIDGAAAELEQADGEADAEATTVTPDGGTRERKPAGRRLAAAMMVAAVLFVGSAAFAGASVPVSYTHLDVYKRQVAASPTWKCCRTRSTTS